MTVSTSEINDKAIKSRVSSHISELFMTFVRTKVCQLGGFKKEAKYFVSYLLMLAVTPVNNDQLD